MKRLIPILLILALLCGCAETPAETTAAPTTLAPTTAPTEQAPPMAPDFTVYDAGGNPVKLSDFMGTPVVLNSGPAGAAPARQRCRILTKPARRWRAKSSF